MTQTAHLSRTESPLRGKLRRWRVALRRTFVQPDSVTVLSLAPEDVARRLADKRSA